MGVVVGLVLFGAVVAACGGPSSPGVAGLGSTTTTTTNPSTQSSSSTQTSSNNQKGINVAFAYSSCMRNHGIKNFPEPTNGAGKVSIRIGPGSGIDPKSPQFQSAQAACRHLLPFGGEGPTITPADQADYLKAVACMRSHGYPNFPDPVMTSHEVRFQVPSYIDQNSTKFKDAVSTCEKLIPAGLPYSGSNGS